MNFLDEIWSGIKYENMYYFLFSTYSYEIVIRESNFLRKIPIYLTKKNIMYLKNPIFTQRKYMRFIYLSKIKIYCNTYWNVFQATF